MQKIEKIKHCGSVATTFLGWQRLHSFIAIFRPAQMQIGSDMPKIRKLYYPTLSKNQRMYKATLIAIASLFFFSAGAQSTVVTADSIGIGTTTPGAQLDVNGTVSIGPHGSIMNNPSYSGYKLFVNGNIAAQKLKVSQTDWADNVFDSTYRLVPLAQVDRFVRYNRHLPALPSASSVGRDGLDVGDMQKLLLQKIEELTLYIIAQDKRIAHLENKRKR